MGRMLWKMDRWKKNGEKILPSPHEIKPKSIRLMSAFMCRYWIESKMWWIIDDVYHMCEWDKTINSRVLVSKCGCKAPSHRLAQASIFCLPPPHHNHSYLRVKRPIFGSVQSCVFMPCSARSPDPGNNLDKRVPALEGERSGRDNVHSWNRTITIRGADFIRKLYSSLSAGFVLSWLYVCIYFSSICSETGGWVAAKAQLRLLNFDEVKPTTAIWSILRTERFQFKETNPHLLWIGCRKCSHN